MTIYIKVKKPSGKGRQDHKEVNSNDPARMRPPTLPYISPTDQGLSPLTGERI